MILQAYNIYNIGLYSFQLSFVDCVLLRRFYYIFCIDPESVYRAVYLPVRCSMSCTKLCILNYCTLCRTTNVLECIQPDIPCVLHNVSCLYVLYKHITVHLCLSFTCLAFGNAPSIRPFCVRFIWLNHPTFCQGSGAKTKKNKKLPLPLGI